LANLNPHAAQKFARAVRNAVVEQTAGGATIGWADLYLDAHTTGSSLLQKWEQVSESTLRTPVRTLDMLISQFGVPQFWKIDVEGFEREVLAGLHTPITAMSFEFRARIVNEAIECLVTLRELGEFVANFTGTELSEWSQPD